MERFTGITYVVPCGGAKLDRPAPARELYTGSMFRHTLAAALAAAACDEAEGRGPARVLILSALYGLLELDTVIEPYDLKMGEPDSVTADELVGQAEALGMGWGPGGDLADTPGEVYGMLPRAYLAVLDEALRELYVYVQDVYEGCSGNLQQKRVNVIVRDAGEPATTPAEPKSGPEMLIGGDVAALWWGVPVLVSYGRLREARELPRASAPWALDSRAFNELDEHGTWTIPAVQYAADVNRYAAEIGRLRWVAPQDWPARTSVLAKTGLTVHEHQRRTIASVFELRQLITSVDVLDVVTGESVEDFVRHVAMYAAAGVDLTDGRLVGVGALVGRPAAEAAAVIRALWALGIRRMHGFGLKGDVLELVGPLLESVDSAAWSLAARHRGGLCQHPGSGVKYERNCPIAAQQWGAQQEEIGARADVQLALFAA